MTYPKIALYFLAPLFFVIAVIYRSLPFAAYSIVMALFCFGLVKYDERRRGRSE
jgi:hypothetical protein